MDVQTVLLHVAHHVIAHVKGLNLVMVAQVVLLLVVPVLQVVHVRLVQMIAHLLAKMVVKMDVRIHVLLHAKELQLASPQLVQSMDMNMLIWGLVFYGPLAI